MDDMIVTIMNNKNKQHVDAVKKMAEQSRISIEPLEVVSQNVLIALNPQDKVLGFLAYKEDYNCDYIPATPANNIFVTSVEVELLENKTDILSDFYQYLQDLYPSHEIYVKALSSDTANVRILTEKGFVFHTVVENRNREDIDVVCFKYDPI